jgi:hypothetical protein
MPEKTYKILESEIAYIRECMRQIGAAAYAMRAEADLASEADRMDICSMGISGILDTVEHADRLSDEIAI